MLVIDTAVGTCALLQTCSTAVLPSAGRLDLPQTSMHVKFFVATLIFEKR
jgi:hypothetical protein